MILAATRVIHRRILLGFTSSTFRMYETLSLSKKDHVGIVKLNRPSKRNAMNSSFWKECKDAFEELGQDGDVRAIVLYGEGKVFTSGLDLGDIGIDLFGKPNEDPCRKAFRLKKHVSHMQEAFNSIEKIPQPVIASIHGACIGGGIDLIAACDIRLCSAETVFSIKEVAIGLAADLGTLQRVPHIIGNHSLFRELAYTGRNFTAAEALNLGLVSRVLANAEETTSNAIALAQEIASKSPVAVFGTKHNLLYSRDHSITDGLNYMTTWNMAALQTEDVAKSVQSALIKETPSFSKL